jgi:hypothetical protein
VRQRRESQHHGDADELLLQLHCFFPL